MDSDPDADAKTRYVKFERLLHSGYEHVVGIEIKGCLDPCSSHILGDRVSSKSCSSLKVRKLLQANNLTQYTSGQVDERIALGDSLQKLIRFLVSDIG